MSKLVLLLLTLFLALHPSSPRPEPFAMHISCGARLNVHTPPTNTVWYKDFGYTGGRPGNASLINNIVPPLKTLRYFTLSDGPENCYNIKRVPNGHYSVRIFFGLVADPNFESEPLFDVSIEGTQIYSLESGWSTTEDQSFAEALVFVPDGMVSSCVHSTGHGDPAILSIEILQVDDKAYYYGPGWGQGTVLRTAKRLNCGSVLAKFDADYDGHHWGGDRFWQKVTSFGQGSDKIRSNQNSIRKAYSSPNFYPKEIYQTAIIGTDGQPDLSYSMDVEPNRNYSIWLHFAEIDAGITNVGHRVFDILINGDIAFKDVDIIGMSGDTYTAIVLNKTVAINGRTLTITMNPTKGSAIINAIEVFELISAESKTLTEEVGALQKLKNALGLPLRFGWNGDPCVPQQHPWSGVDCQFDRISAKWFIDGLGLDNQGLRGFLPSDIAKLRHLQSINLSGNSIRGTIPSSLGAITRLEVLDLSFNFFNDTIPESLGMLTSLRRLNLNSNFLSGRVPAALGGRLLHRASFNMRTWTRVYEQPLCAKNTEGGLYPVHPPKIQIAGTDISFTGNAGLCGIPGLPTCGPHLSTGSKIGIAFGVFVAFILLLVCSMCWWKRRQNILRAQRIAARDAPYAKARTQFVRDVQLTRHHELVRSVSENGPSLLS